MKRRKTEYFLLFGFDESDIDNVGFFGKSNEIVQDEDDAKKFFKPRKGKSGTPEQWLKMINEDPDLNHGFKFHLVKRTFFVD